MMQNKYKKKMLLIPSAYNKKVMGDVEHFIPYYKDVFDLYVIYDGKNRTKDGVTYLNKIDKESKYLKLTADYIIDAGSINGKTRVSESQKRISVWHGIPYKNMFLDVDESYIFDVLKYTDGCDLMISPSNYYTNRFLRNSMLYNGEVLETAVSRTDGLFLSQEEKNKIKIKLGIPLDKKILLYAPTFREKGKTKLNFNVDKLLKKLNSKNDEWIIVTKLHYLNVLESNSNNIIDCTSYPNVNHLLSICDLLISDYSSLFFDYSILKKPVLFFQYDQEEYCKSRGFMFELSDYVDKKYIVKNEKDLLSIIDKVKDVNNLSKVKKEFYPYQKEKSTSDLVNKLNLDTEVRKTKDIIFLVNDLNEIGGVHAFILNLAKLFKEKYNSRIFVFGAREYATKNDLKHKFETDKFVDIKLSNDANPKEIKCILQNTDGYIISCQFYAHKVFQKYLKNKNSILMFHGNMKEFVNGKIFNWQYKALVKHNLYNYKKFILLTKSNKEYIEKFVNKKIKKTLGYIENSFDYSNRKSLYKNNNEYVYITRLDDDKNVFDIIKIFSSNKLNKNIKLHVYGDGKLSNAFKNAIKENNLSDRIIFHGYCSNKYEMFKDKAGYISVSLTEGFPIVIMEAINYGIPCIIYDSYLAVKDLSKSKLIKSIKPLDIDAFVSALNKGFNYNEKEYDILVKEYSNDFVLDKWIKVFEEMENIKTIRTFYSKEKLKNSIQNIINFSIKVILHFLKINDQLKYYICNIYIYCIYIIYKFKKIIRGKKQCSSLVSIIVPFYNNLNVVENVIKSIKNNGYKNYEVIVINDGSKDDPTFILEKYKNIKYYYKQNEGLGLTREFGINKAKGKYVMFVDSDDVLCKGAIEYLVDYAEKNKLSVVSGLCRKVNFCTKKTSHWYRKIYNKTYINTFEKRHNILFDTITTNKIYNLNDLKESNIKFEKGLYEDKLYIAKLYEYFNKIGIINKYIYTWYSYGENTSITTSVDYKNNKERLKRVKSILELSSEKNKTYYLEILLVHDSYIFSKNIMNMNKEEAKKIFNEIVKLVNKNIKYLYLSNSLKSHKKELIKCIIENDFNRFYTISKCINWCYKNNKLPKDIN